MKIILSQKIDSNSKYDDIPYHIYHFPRRYRKQINPGDLFVYYQGDRSKKENRYYFGHGVIGSINELSTGDFHALIIQGEAFPRKVPIYSNEGGFHESFGYEKIRSSPDPSWRNSIRKLSDEAYERIILMADTGVTDFQQISIIEQTSNPIYLLQSLNNRYEEIVPEKRERYINAQIDRGSSITNALKTVLGSTCQVCGYKGFKKKDGSQYIEAHHITQLSLCKSSSLCSDNIILLCPNCHKEAHYGNVVVVDKGSKVFIKLGNKEASINKNTIEYLKTRLEKDLIFNSTVIE